MRFIESLKLAGLLSFPPDMEPFELESLNVLIGPNGSGKSNFIEAFELLQALPTDFAMALADGGGVDEWIWKGSPSNRAPRMDLTIEPIQRNGGVWHPRAGQLRYRLDFREESRRVRILDEAIEEAESNGGDCKRFFHYRLTGDSSSASPVIGVRDGPTRKRTELLRSEIDLGKSILAQRRDPYHYPELTWLGQTFSEIQTFREWSFGYRSEVRRPQRTDLPGDRLLPDASNLAVIVNNLDSWGRRQEFNDLLKRLFPRVERLSTPVIGGTVQLLLHETGFDTPIPAARMSDGTLRFIAMLAVLLSPEPPPLVCIEEPELGLHPDAVALMAEVLSEASERMQLVVTTHSDALVSALTNRPSAIVACERPGDGTVLRRLDPERLAHWLEDDYALGDLWRMGALGANP